MMKEPLVVVFINYGLIVLNLLACGWGVHEQNYGLAVLNFGMFLIMLRHA